jgi:hypothetical protein
MGYQLKFPGNSTFGFTVDIPDKKKLDGMITKLLKYQVAVNREKIRVYRSIDGLLQSNQKKTIHNKYKGIEAVSLGKADIDLNSLSCPPIRG